MNTFREISFDTESQPNRNVQNIENLGINDSNN